MSTPSRLVLILGDQLDLQNSVLRNVNLQSEKVLMIESANEAQYVWSHKAKIALFLSAMRHFAKALESLQYPLIYVKESKLSIVEELKVQLKKYKVKHLVCIEPGEWRLKVAI